MEEPVRIALLLLLLLMRLRLRYYQVVSEGGGFAGPKTTGSYKHRCAVSQTNRKLAQDIHAQSRTTRCPASGDGRRGYLPFSLHLLLLLS